MKQKGQALVEFILVLPIVLLIIVSLIDIGNIFLEKYSLNNDVNTVASLYESDKIEQAHKYAYDNNFIISDKSEDGLITIIITKSVKVETPILNRVIGNNYQIEAKKTIYNDGDFNE